jgi:hypothetical protein
MNLFVIIVLRLSWTVADDSGVSSCDDSVGETLDRVVDLSQSNESIAATVRQACVQHGFFYVVNHGIDDDLIKRLESLSRQFFALDESVKQRYAMKFGGRAWRGYFPLGGELTSGIPDWKTGLYLGTSLPESDQRVIDGEYLHGANLIPGDDVLEGFETTINEARDSNGFMVWLIDWHRFVVYECGDLTWSHSDVTRCTIIGSIAELLS